MTIKLSNLKEIYKEEKNEIHYPLPLHLQKASKNLRYKKGNFPVAEKQAKEMISLPVHQYLKKKHLIYMVKKIKEFYKK